MNASAVPAKVSHEQSSHDPRGPGGAVRGRERGTQKNRKIEERKREKEGKRPVGNR